MTSRQFHLLGKRHAKREKRTLDMFRYLATATARAQGHDVNYMEEDAEPVTGEGVDTWDTFAAFLKSKAKTDGATDNDQNGRA